MFAAKRRLHSLPPLNGHGAIWPEADAVSDGKWVKFFQGAKEVFTCNSAYAAHNFEVKRIGPLRRD